MPRPTLSIIIPAFNEAQRIPKTLERVDDFAATLGLHYEILVVDDGSSDGTSEVVKNIAKQRKSVRCAGYERNRGKGHAVRVGMLVARGKVRLMTDADCSIPPEEIPRLIEPLLAGDADVAIGSRYVGESNVRVSQPRWRVAWSRLCNKVVQRTLVGGIEDTQCGFKGFTADAAREIFAMTKIDGWAFDLEVLALARDRDLKVEEIGVEWHDDPRSKINPVKDFLKVLGEWWTIRKNLRSGVYAPLELAAASTRIPQQA
jgi:dolichyl-phosphate beta-glucosyltransferase